MPRRLPPLSLPGCPFRFEPPDVFHVDGEAPGRSASEPPAHTGIEAHTGDGEEPDAPTVLIRSVAPRPADTRFECSVTDPQ